MSSRDSSKAPKGQIQGPDGGIDKLDFDANRRHHLAPPPAASSHGGGEESIHSGSHRSLLADDDDFFSDIVDGAIEQDRKKMARNVTKYASFASAILACLCAGSITAYSLYGPLFLRHLKYSQYQVNAVSTTAELAMYLPVPIFGWLCDRYNPRPLSLLSGILFGVGYGLAAGVYGAGPGSGGEYRSDTGEIKEGGWPFWVMILAFVGVGMGTCTMYLAAVTTCAKNFGRGKYKGIALAIPIAAFGLSGMWQSLVGSYFFRDDTMEGDVDVFRYFCFLGGLLFAVGLVGAVGLRVVDEEELINEGVGELERSGLLNGSALLADERAGLLNRIVLHDGENGDVEVRNGHANGYGTLDPRRDDTDSIASGQGKPNNLTDDDNHHDENNDTKDDGLATKKTRLLNAETTLFLSDPTAYLLAAGFFLTTGPGEAYINNLGTLIHTLYAPGTNVPSINSPATHVSIVALTSTIARLATGVLSDLFAPNPQDNNKNHQHRNQQNKRFCTLPRPSMLLLSTLIFSLGQLLLTTPLISPTSYRNLLPLVTALIGTGYGAIFSLTPMLISVVWGVQNFGTNWGIVAVVPAGGAAVWGAIYSGVYSAGRGSPSAGIGGGGGGVGEGRGEECFGRECYMVTFAAMTVASWCAIVLWGFAWRGWRRKGLFV